MSLDYERGDLLFEDDFSSGLGQWNTITRDGAEGGSNVTISNPESYAEVTHEGDEARLYVQHDGTAATGADKLPCDSIAAIETAQSWNRSAFVEVHFSYVKNPTWLEDGDTPKDPYLPGVLWGQLGDFPYDKREEFPRNDPMRDGWGNRYGTRDWPLNFETPTPQVANDRYDNFEIVDEIEQVADLPQNEQHVAEAVAVDEEAQMLLTRSDGSTDFVGNTLAEVIGASSLAFAEGDNLGISDDQALVYDQGNPVALGTGTIPMFVEGQEIATTESVAVSQQENSLVLEVRIVNSFDGVSEEGWIDMRVQKVKVWEAVKTA